VKFPVKAAGAKKPKSKAETERDAKNALGIKKSPCLSKGTVAIPSASRPPSVRGFQSNAKTLGGRRDLQQAQAKKMGGKRVRVKECTTAAPRRWVEGVKSEQNTVNR